MLGLLLAAPVLLIAIPFWFVASLTRILAQRLGPRSVPWNELIDFDPSIGWKPRSDLDVYYLADRDPDFFHVVTGPDGWPGHASIEDSELVVLGDSYAFGFGVDAEDSFAAPGADLRIKAIGAPGYNMVQELMLMRTLAPALARKLVVWFVYYGNDLYDNLSPEMAGYRTPFVRERDGSAGWEIVTSHVRQEKWTSSAGREATQWLSVLAALHSRTPLAQRAFSACEFLIGQGNEVCSEAGAKLLVVGLPSPRTLSRSWLEQLATHRQGSEPVEAELPDSEMARICGALGVPFVAAREHLNARDFRPIDDHWNERGHRRIRKLLRGIQRDHGFATGEASRVAK